jgi:hypothetical protein
MKHFINSSKLLSVLPTECKDLAGDVMLLWSTGCRSGDLFSSSWE